MLAQQGRCTDSREVQWEFDADAVPGFLLFPAVLGCPTEFVSKLSHQHHLSVLPPTKQSPGPQVLDPGHQVINGAGDIKH